ncbi:uncharacterized protein G2W53_043278 [Senna tora]|uniref:Uncharacterized protein n=1 Tax=Senna tora TaxID=362788 RepID=A0A834SNR2_9FABA|nr:uncharacterized protein G2W53_043278 [Senna tora]
MIDQSLRVRSRPSSMKAPIPAEVAVLSISSSRPGKSSSLSFAADEAEGSPKPPPATPKPPKSEAPIRRLLSMRGSSRRARRDGEPQLQVNFVTVIWRWRWGFVHHEPAFIAVGVLVATQGLKGIKAEGAE